MGYLGEKLQEAREKKGATLEDASSATKIKVAYLRALEAEDYADLPPRAYVKGFLKIYAHYLTLDYVLLSRLYEESYELPDAQMVFSNRQSPPSLPFLPGIKWKSVLGGIFTAIIIFLIIWGVIRLIGGSRKVITVSVHFSRVDNPYQPETIEWISLEDLEVK